MNQIHFIGYDAIHPANFVFDLPEGHNCYLLLLTHTPALFEHNGVRKEYAAHQAILYRPHSPIWYAACQGAYGNDFLRFSSDESFVTGFPVTEEPFPVSDPEYCHNLFQLLTWEKIQRNQPETVSQLLQVLFSRLYDDVRSRGRTPHSHMLLRLRKEITNRPQNNWRVEDMAQQLHLSQGYLQYLYKKQFGVSCVEDVIRCRLRMAREYLAHTDQSVSQIALLCGYRSTEHFCRQFRRYSGMTPGRYRRQAGQTPAPDESAKKETRIRTVAGSHEIDMGLEEMR